MSAALPPVLIVDDERNMRLSLESMLAAEKYAAVSVESAEEGLRRVDREKFLMVITDAHLGGMSGYELLEKLRQGHPELPVLMITAYATPRLAVEAIKSGAIDYLAKPFEPEELFHAVRRCADRARLLEENALLRVKAAAAAQTGPIIGESPKIQELRRLIKTVAVSNASVLILGESGTGKELIAAAIHAQSPRRDAGYVRLNCAALQENLLESELFGHEKGAFTGAVKQKVGRVEEADGGTLFLDEIGDMSRPLQAKLLRFLEDGSFTRVGGNQELKVDVRLIAATNRDIIQAIRENQFREDLFHRLNVFKFDPPPLRERGDDILLLADHFLRQFTTAMGKHIHGIHPAARQKLLQHHWPGNVRELRNVIERAVILESGAEIHPRNLPDFQAESGLRKSEAPNITGAQSIDELMNEYERELILHALEQSRYNLGRTADVLKISRHALRYRMQRLNIVLDTDQEDAATQLPAVGVKEKEAP